MGKVEIKIRKKILTPDSLQQYRNYPALLKKYERNKRFKRAFKIFIYSLALTLFVLALIFLGMWKVLMDKKAESKQRNDHYQYILIGKNQSHDTLNVRILQSGLENEYYTLSYQHDTSTQVIYLKLPRYGRYKKEGETYRFLAGINISLNHRSYYVANYSSDDTLDENEIFYSPDFGILIVKLTDSGKYRQLVRTNNKQYDQIIEQLIYSIKSDSSFFGHQSP